MLDCKVPADQTLAKAAPRMGEFISSDSQVYFQTIKDSLTALKINFIEDPQLVRGLDYYAECVFEYHIQGGSGEELGAIGAGGQYNNLVQDFGGQPLRAVGFAFGMERIIAILKTQGRLDEVKSYTDIYIIAMNKEADLYAFKLAHNFRHTNFRTELNVEHKSMKSAIKAAVKKEALYAVIIGDQEVKTKTVTIKNLKTEEQQVVPVQEVVHLMQHLTNQAGHHHHDEEEKE
jgi:histidyl-tRNA synthetase